MPRLFVTTNNHIFLVEYSTRKRRFSVERLWSKYSWFTGCDWDDRYIYVAARDSPHFGGKLGETIIRFDRRLRFVDVWYRSRQVLDMHQICVLDGSLWITNTYHNGFRVLNIETRVEQDYFPYDNGTTPGSFERGDRNHFNTIRTDGKQLFIIANNYVVRDGLRKRRSNSRLLVVDPQTQKITKDVAIRGQAAHDIWIEDGSFRTFDSARGVICGPDADAYWTGEPWLRGVAITDRIMFIGKSGLASSEQRAAGNGEVCAVDRRTGQIMARAEVPGAGGIFDMLLLDERDLARFHKPAFFELP